jgi:hypothetical protein
MQLPDCSDYLEQGYDLGLNQNQMQQQSHWQQKHALVQVLVQDDAKGVVVRGIQN